MSPLSFDTPVHRSGIRSLLHRPSLSLISGVALAVSYTLFAWLAARYYPIAYSPFHNNTLSQLGNRNLNPGGFGYYLIGCAISGAFAIAFFASLIHWKRTGSRLQNRLLAIVQGLGIIGGFALIMNAVFPENQLQLHHFWAGLLFNSLGAAMLLSPVALWRRTRPNIHLTGVSVLSFATVIVMFIFARYHWVEWLPVSMFLIAPPLLGFHTTATAARTLEPLLAG